MKHKLTNGSTGGNTHYGLEEIKLREAAQEKAITAVILQFVPVEQHDAVIQHMETATREYYESIGLGEAYEQQLAREAMEDRSCVTKRRTPVMDVLPCVAWWSLFLAGGASRL